jgi:hypothetical protein
MTRAKNFGVFVVATIMWSALVFMFWALLVRKGGYVFLVAPTPSASAPGDVNPGLGVKMNDALLVDFDFGKKDRQIAWCYAHRGMPTMTFTLHRSNVLCLKPEAVIVLPLGDGGR